MGVRFRRFMIALLIMCILTGCTAFYGYDDNLLYIGEKALIQNTPEPEPSNIPTVAPAAAPTPMQTPEPTPEPVPTAKPFSELAPTTTMRFEELVGDNGNYDEPETFPPSDTYKIVIDVYHQVVMVYERDENGEYSVPVRYMVCTTGAVKTPTPIGTFKMLDTRHRFGYFVDYGVYGQYWTRVVRSIYFHTLLYNKRNASTYTTTSYNQLGKRGSHGCIRLLVPDARWIYYNIAPGTEIEIRKGSKDDEQTASIKKQLVRAPLPKKRPNLKPGEVPITDPWWLERVSGMEQ